MNDKEKEELRLKELAQEADKERVKSWWYVGKLFNGAIKKK